MAKAHLIYSNRFYARLCIVLMCGLPALFASATEITDASAVADFRLLVDVSGSMKQSDPQNLRSEGLTLLTKMLPTDTRVGLWRFAASVDEVMPPGPVNERWRQRTLDSLPALRAVGQLTDIGAALSRAGRAPANNERAHILLLTDGKVDVHAKPEGNARERDSILTQLVPQLVARGFVIHTIALSGDADAELLQAIAAASAGEHRVVTNRDELVSVFVDILDQAVPPQRLPIINNGFTVGDSVDELTVLMYHDENTPQRPHLLDPDMQPINAKQQATLNAESARWLSRPRYDLVTIPKPKNGRWQLVNGGPEPRVTILTDLTLQVLPHPQKRLPSEPFELSFVLREQGQVLTDPALLEHVKAQLSVTLQGQSEASADSFELPAKLRSADANGRFLLRSVAPDFEGHYQLSLRVDGATFAREYQRRLEVISAFSVTLEKQTRPSTQGQTVAYQVEVTANSALDDEHTEVVAHVKDSSGANALLMLEHLSEGLWGLTVTPKRHARYVIELQAKGLDRAGRKISQTLEPQYFTYPAVGDPQPPLVDDSLIELENALAAEREALARERGTRTPEPVASTAASSASSSARSVAAVLAPRQDTGGIRWWLVVVVVLFNIALLGGIYGLYRRFKGKTVESELEELVEPVSDDQPTDDSEAEPPSGAFDDVFADMDEPAPTAAGTSAPKLEVEPESEPELAPSESDDAIQLDLDDPGVVLDESDDSVAPEPSATEPPNLSSADAEPSDRESDKGSDKESDKNQDRRD